jgi:polyisoprenoid-binding protein YceI
MSNVEERFTAFAGRVTLAEPVERSAVAVTIDAASIDTGNAERDAHLRSPDFLDVARFPGADLPQRGWSPWAATGTRWKGT